MFDFSIKSVADKFQANYKTTLLHIRLDHLNFDTYKWR